MLGLVIGYTVGTCINIFLMGLKLDVAIAIYLGAMSAVGFMYMLGYTKQK